MPEENESARLRTLHEYGILDTLPEEELDALVKLASGICKVPIALISLIDKDRQWFKAREGLDVQETPREYAFCHHAIKSHDIYEVTDAKANPIFKDNPFVTGDPNIRFYAGAPLTSPDGYNIGTLCVIDTSPRALTEEQKTSLRLLSGFVMTQFELRKTKKELEDSRQHYQDLIDRATDIIYTCNVKGEFTFISPSVKKITGYSDEQLIGKHFSTLIAAPHMERVQAFYLDQFSRRIEETLQEFEMVTASGEKKWVEQTVVQLFHNGDRKGFHGIVRDISERKKTEAQMREKDKKFSTIFHMSPAAMVVFDTATNQIVEANGSFCELTGFSQEELLRLSPEERRLVPESERKRILSEFHRTGDLNNISIVLQRKNGELRNVLQSSHTITIDDKKYGLSILFDVTEQKKLEAALREKDAQFAVMFHASPVAMSLGSLQPYQYTEVNESFSQLTGYSHAELIGLDFANSGLIGAKERKALLEKFAKQGYLRNEELEISVKNRMKRWILLSTELVTVAEEKMALSVYHDITERKQLEQQLTIAKELAEQSGRAKEQFLANMSHEIRTPMNAVLGFTELLSETKLSKEQQEFVGAISTSGKSLMSIINDILDYSKIEAGMLSIVHEPISIRSIFSSLSVTFSDQAKKKKLHLRFLADRKLPEVVSGDPVRLTQIITNLAGNAIKFTKKGSIGVSATVKEKTKSQVIVEFKVSDTGIGIPKDKVDSIFERFNQGSNDTTRHYGGTGLGLSIVKKLAELQGGTVAVKSTPKKGSVFTVTIPYALVAQGDKAAVKEKTVRSAKAKKVHILLVEDNRLNQQLAQRVLRDFGFTTDIAENGKIAVEKIRKHRYDIVLMDMQMPVMNGYEATQYIRKKLRKKLPIIAMTAHAMASEQEKCIEAGMNDYVAKPFRKEALYEKIIALVHAPAVTSTSKPRAKKSAVVLKTLRLTELEKLANGDQQFVREVLQIFLQDTPADLEALEEGVKKKDYAVIRSISHKLKSSMQLMGLEKLSPALKETEILATEEKGFPTIRKHFTVVKKTLEEALKEAKQFVG